MFDNIKTFLKSSGYTVVNETATSIILSKDDFYVVAKIIENKICIYVTNKNTYNMPRFLVGETPNMPYVENASMKFLYGGGYI